MDVTGLPPEQLQEHLNDISLEAIRLLAVLFPLAFAFLAVCLPVHLVHGDQSINPFPLFKQLSLDVDLTAIEGIQLSVLDLEVALFVPVLGCSVLGQTFNPAAVDFALMLSRLLSGACCPVSLVFLCLQAPVDCLRPRTVVTFMRLIDSK